GSPLRAQSRPACGTARALHCPHGAAGRREGKRADRQLAGDNRRSVHPDRSRRRSGHRTDLPGEMAAGLFRLHLLSRYLPNGAARHSRRTREARPGRRQGATLVHHSRSAARHPRRDRGLHAVVRSEDHRAHGHAGADPSPRSGRRGAVPPPAAPPAVMGDHTRSFDPRIIGLTGTPEQIAAVAREYGAYYAPRKIGPGPEDYVMDHSSYLYLMAPEGKFVRGFDADTPGDRLAEVVRDAIVKARD